MNFGPLLRRRTLGASLVGMASLSACTPGSDGDSPATSGASDDGAAGDGSPAGVADAFASLDLAWGQSTVTVGVRPLQRVGHHLVLTLDVQATDATGDLTEDMVRELGYFWGGSTVDDLARPFLGVRLLDLSGDRVASPAMDDAGDTVALSVDQQDGGSDGAPRSTFQIAYGDLGTDTATLYLPKAPLVLDIPVQNGEALAPAPGVHPVDLTTISEAPVTPMVTSTFDLLAPLVEESSPESSTLRIGSDVLFDSSSDELSDSAQDVLDETARRILTYDSGTVTVTGHTDAVSDTASNLDLSVRRAEAVASALATRVDPEEYPLLTEGKGESTPIADNDTEEGRALNRRVELSLSSAPRKDSSTSGDAALPPFDGQVATGADGVTVGLRSGRQVLLRVREARLITEHLVVTFEATMQDDESTDGVSAGLDGFGAAPSPDSSGLALHETNGGIGILQGRNVTLPALHRPVEDENAELRPLTDLNTNARMDGGVPRTLELVFPGGMDGIAPGEVVTLQHDYSGKSLFRLTDISIDG